MSTELTVLERAQVALQPAANERQLAELAAASKSITTITNADGYKQAHAARMALKNQRVTIEKVAKAARQDATDFQRACVAEEKRLIAIVEPEERRLESLQTAYDAARAAEKKAREEAERARVGEIQRRLAKLQTLPEVYTSTMPPDRLAEVIQQLEGGLSFDYQEFATEAETSRQTALIALRAAHVEALERLEREAAAEAARVAKAAKEAAERAEAERIETERRAAEEARLAEERARLEAEAALARQAREAEEARLAAERARLAEEERRAKEAREADAAQERERIRLERAAEEQRAAAERARLAEEAEAQRQRQAAIDAENARIRAEQEARQAEIERQEREHREAEEARQEALRIEEERRAAEATRDRIRAERRAQCRSRIETLTAVELIDFTAAGLLTGGFSDPDEQLIAARICEIPHEEWLELARDQLQESAA